MRIIILFIIAGIYVSITSCVFNIVISKNFTLRNKSNLSDEKKLKMNGIYYGMVNKDFYVRKKDTTIYKPIFIILYNDGYSASGGSYYTKIDSVVSYLKTISKKRLQKKGVDWGRYVISGDTIICQFFTLQNDNIYNVIEERGIILNDSTILMFKLQCNYCANDEYKKYYDPPVTFRFYPLDEKPDSINWIMKKSKYNR